MPAEIEELMDDEDERRPLTEKAINELAEKILKDIRINTIIDETHTVAHWNHYNSIYIAHMHRQNRNFPARINHHYLKITPHYISKEEWNTDIAEKITQKLQESSYSTLYKAQTIYNTSPENTALISIMGINY